MDEQTPGQERADSKGVVNGVGGHARFLRIYLDYDDSHSESEDVEERVHEHGTKPGEMSVDDIVAFLSGDADLQLDFDAVELPPELGEDKPQPASSPSKSQAAPSLVESLGGLPCAGKALFN